MSIGSLREQIIYPDSLEDMIAKDINEEKLREILRMVSLEHIAVRDSFDEVKDWKDTLSGGEKQRMAIARLFYHKYEKLFFIFIFNNFPNFQTTIRPSRRVHISCIDRC